MPRIPNRQIDEAETIVRNSEFLTIYQEYNLLLDRNSYRAVEGYYKKFDKAFVPINNQLRQACPSIKWRRKFTEEFCRNLPENTKTYQRQAQFVPD